MSRRWRRIQLSPKRNVRMTAPLPGEAGTKEEKRRLTAEAQRARKTRGKRIHRRVAESPRKETKSKPESAEKAESAEKRSQMARKFCQFRQEFNSVGTDGRGC